MEHLPDTPIVRPETPAYPVHIVIQERSINVYPVYEQELDMLAALSNSLNLTFFGLTFGGMISFGIVLLTVSRTQEFYPIFVALFTVALVLTAYFGIQARRDYTRAVEQVKQIKSQRMG